MTITLSFAVPADLQPDWPSGALGIGGGPAPSPAAAARRRPGPDPAVVAGRSEPASVAAAGPAPLATIRSIVLGELAWLVVDAAAGTRGAAAALTAAPAGAAARALPAGRPEPTVADLLALLGAQAERLGLTLVSVPRNADESEAAVVDLVVTAQGGSSVRGQPCVVVVSEVPPQ